MTTAKITIGAIDATGAAFASAKARLASLGAESSAVVTKLGKIGTAFATIAAGGALGAFFRSTVAGIDNLNDLADATGASIANLSALEDTARRTGTSVDVVGDALIKLNKTIADAKPGSDQAAALKAIGLSAEELRKLDPAEALLRTAQALSGFADDGNKARLTQELFGKSLKDVAPLLKDLAEKGQLNATVTKEQAEAAEAFRKQTFELDKNLTDLSRTITSAVVPALNKMFERVKAGGLLAIFAPSETQKQITQATDLSLSITKVGDALARAAALSERADLPGSARAKWAEEATRLRAQLDGLQRESLKITDTLKGSPSVDGAGARDALRRIEGAVGGRRSLPAIGGGDKPPDKPRTFVDDLSGESDSFRRALSAIASTDTAKLRELQDTLSRLFELQRETRGDPAVAQAIAAVNKEIGELTSKAPPVKHTQAFADALAAMANTDAAKIQELSAALQELYAIEAEGIFSPQTSEAIERLKKQIKELKEPVGEVSEFSREAARNIQDALGNSLVAAMDGSTKSIGDIWKNMIKRMIAEAASARLAELLLGKGYGSSTGKIGGLLDAASTFFGGSGGGDTNIVKEVGGQLSKTGGMTVIVQGDVGPKAMRAMRVAQAEAEARSNRRMAIGGG